MAFALAKKEMKNEISVHDNFLLSYHVDAEDERIVFRTEYRDGSEIEKTDVTFEGVSAYHFEGDIFTSIIFDMEEMAPSSIYKQYEDLFDRKKNYGWPKNWKQKEESFEGYLTRLGLKSYWIQSSSGLDGFVIAKEMRKSTTANQAVDTTAVSAPRWSSRITLTFEERNE